MEIQNKIINLTNIFIMKKFFLLVALAISSVMLFGGNIRFEKITDASSLANNDSVILVYEAGKVANGAAGSKQLTSVSMTINSNDEVEIPEETAKSSYLRLIKSGSNWKIQRGNTYMRYHKSEYITFDTSDSDTKTYTSTWTFSFNSGNVILASTAAPTWVFRCNIDNTPFFRIYKSGYGQDVQLYRRIPDQATSVTGVELDNTELNKRVGDASVTLTATVKPSNATVKTVTWGCTNTAVATVSNGTVAFVGVGEAKVWVKTDEGDKSDTCYVTVLPALDNTEATYKAVQKADYLPAGAKVFFGTVKDGENYVMGLYASGNNIKGIAATYGEKHHSVTAKMAYAYTVEKDGSYYLFKDQDGKYLSTLSSTKLGSGNKDDYAKWTLGAFDEDDATVLLTNYKNNSSSIYNNFQGTNDLFNVYNNPGTDYCAKVVLYSDKAQDWVDPVKNPTMTASGDALATVDGKLTLDWGKQEPDPYVSGGTNPWGDSRKFIITINDLSDDVEVTLDDLTGTFYCGWVSSGIKKDRTTPAEITVFWEAATKGTYTASLKFHTATAGVDDIVVYLKAEAVEEGGGGGGETSTPELIISDEAIVLNPNLDFEDPNYMAADATFTFSAKNLAKALRMEWHRDNTAPWFPWSSEKMNIYMIYDPMGYNFQELTVNQKADLGTDDITNFELYIACTGIQNVGTYESELHFTSLKKDSKTDYAIDVVVPITVKVTQTPIATGLENISTTESAAKFLRDGQIIIIRNNVEYGIDGKRL